MGSGRARGATVALAVGALLSFAGVATPAFGAASPAGTGRFTTWTAARTAAGYTLLKPGDTYGLRRSARILVQRCDGYPHARDVGAAYSHRRASIFWDQINYRYRCGDVGEATFLARYRVNGVWARMMGYCGGPGEPRCTSRTLYGLALLWAKHGVSYLELSTDLPRSTVIGFARHLRRVG